MQRLLVTCLSGFYFPWITAILLLVHCIQQASFCFIHVGVESGQDGNSDASYFKIMQTEALTTYLEPETCLLIMADVVGYLCPFFTSVVLIGCIIFQLLVFAQYLPKWTLDSTEVNDEISFETIRLWSTKLDSAHEIFFLLFFALSGFLLLKLTLLLFAISTVLQANLLRNDLSEDILDETLIEDFCYITHQEVENILPRMTDHMDSLSEENYKIEKSTAITKEDIILSSFAQTVSHSQGYLETLESYGQPVKNIHSTLLNTNENSHFLLDARPYRKIHVYNDEHIMLDTKLPTTDHCPEITKETYPGSSLMTCHEVNYGYRLSDKCPVLHQSFNDKGKKVTYHDMSKYDELPLESAVRFQETCTEDAERTVNSVSDSNLENIVTNRRRTLKKKIHFPVRRLFSCFKR